MVKIVGPLHKKRPKIYSRRRRIGTTRKKKAPVACIGCNLEFQPYQLALHESKCDQFLSVFHSGEQHQPPEVLARIQTLKSLIKPPKEFEKNIGDVPNLRILPRNLSGEKLRGPHNRHYQAPMSVITNYNKEIRAKKAARLGSGAR